MPITPDTKDWTWVLDRRCEECGFDPANWPRESIAPAVRDNAATWAAVLARPGASSRTREDRWSDLEYGCHVRDVHRVFSGRLDLMLAGEDPTFENWDQDAIAGAGRYETQDPSVVAVELRDAARAYADRLDALTPAQWPRPGTRSNGSRFSVETLARYALHDVVHHLRDVSAPD